MTIADQIVACREIDIRLAPYDWPLSRDEADAIAASWAARRRAKPKLFDGRILLMRDLALDDAHLIGSCFETRYKDFLYGRDRNFPGAPVANLFAMAALLSVDGAYMLGEMNAGTSSAGRLYFPAGTPEPADLDADGRIDLEANLLRELAEETGVTAAEVALDRDWTVVVDMPRVACMRIVRSRETAAALQARLAAHNATQADPELSRLVPVASAKDYDRARMPGFMLCYLDHVLAQAP